MAYLVDYFSRWKGHYALAKKEKRYKINKKSYDGKIK